MKPKKNNKNSNKSNNNNKRSVQQQQQQQQQQASVSSEMKESKSDGTETAETTDTMTSSVVECPAANTQNSGRHIPSANNSDSGQSATHLPSRDADHVTDRCADDVTSDVEVADILHAVPAVDHHDLGVAGTTTSDAEVTEVIASEPRSEQVTTEVIMAKTFTESSQPDREFVPIRPDTDDVINPLPAESADSATTLTVRCELVSQTSPAAETTSGRRAVTSSDSVTAASGQVRDLASEFRHLQSLLDDLSSSAAVHADRVDTSSEEELTEDWRQPSAATRVVYLSLIHI